MAIADANGLVTLFVDFADPTDRTSMITKPYSAASTATLGALADVVAADQGLATGSVTLAAHTAPQIAPVLEARATTLATSVIPNGGQVLLVPGS